MKKTSLIITLAAIASIAWAGEAETSAFAADASIGYASDYIYRGKPYANDIMEVTANFSYALSEGTLYAGIEERRAVKGVDLSNNTSTYGVSEINLIGGYKYDIFEDYTLDMGGIYHWYNEEGSCDFRRELYTGITYNGLYVSPSVYFYYDFDQDCWNLELAGSRSYSLDEQLGLENTSLVLGAAVGYVDYQDTNSAQVAGKFVNGWAYIDMSADLVYAINDKVNLIGTVGYSTNNDKEIDGRDKCAYTAVKIGYQF